MEVDMLKPALHNPEGFIYWLIDIDQLLSFICNFLVIIGPHMTPGKVYG